MPNRPVIDCTLLLSVDQVVVRDCRQPLVRSPFGHVRSYLDVEGGGRGDEDEEEEEEAQGDDVSKVKTGGIFLINLWPGYSTSPEAFVIPPPPA
jgi:hypothetical protein